MSDNNWRCPSCGHEQYWALTYATIEVSMLMFCSGCRTVMDRIDALGAIEAEQRGEPGTFEEFREQYG